MLLLVVLLLLVCMLLCGVRLRCETLTTPRVLRSPGHSLSADCICDLGPCLAAADGGVVVCC
jgi:hypothetical protein